MSSILKALKKLEQDATASAEMPDLPGPGQAPAHSKYLLYTLIVVGVMLAAGVFLFIRYQPSVLTAPTAENAGPQKSRRVSVKKTDMSSPTKADRIKPQPAENIESKSPDHPPPADKQQFVAKEGASEAETKTKDTPGAKKARNENKIKEPEKAEAKATPPEANKISGEPPLAAEKSETPPEPIAIPPGAADTPILEDIGLEIQAISWDKTPSRRIAVINSRLCREGERINGFRILKINPDDIVVSNGRKTGTLLFRLN